MAKIEIKMLQDFSDGSRIEHKLCAELLFVLEKHKNSSKIEKKETSKKT